MATTIGTALVEILPDVSKFGPTLERDLQSATKGATAQIGQVDDALDDLGTTGARSADTISRSFSARDLIGSTAIASGAAIAVRSLVGMGSAAVDAASALEESLNAVNVVFGEASQTVIAFGENAAESVGLSQRAFNEAVVPIGALLANFGLDAETAADATLDLATRAADMASVFNVDVSQALGAIGSGLRGETEPLRAFGVNMSEAAIQAEALALGLVSAGETMDPTAKATAALSLIMAQTEQVAGDFAATSDGLANSQRILAGEQENAAAVAGQSLMPAWEALTSAGSALLGVFLDLPAPIQTTLVLLGGLGGVGAASVVGIASIARALGTLGISLSGVATFLTGPWGLAIAGAIAGLGVLLVATRDNEEATRDWEAALAAAEGSIQSAANTTATAFLESNRRAAEQLAEMGLTVDDLARALAGTPEDALAFRNSLTEGLGGLDLFAGGLFAVDAGTAKVTDSLLRFVDETRGARDNAVAFGETAEAIGLSAGEAATATDNLATAAHAVGPAAIDAASGVDYLQGSVPPLTSALELQTEALRGVHDAYRALVDPIFAVRDANAQAREALRLYNRAVRQTGEDSPAAVQAAFDLADAELAVESALLAVSDDAGPAFLVTLRDLRDQGIITQGTFETMRERIRGIGSDADDAAVEVDTKLRPALEGVDRRYEPELEVKGAETALDTVTSVQDRLTELVNRLWPIDIVVDVTGDSIGGGGALKLDSGGRFSAGQFVYSGVPEMFVPDFAGTAVPMSASQVDRLISSISVGVSGETPGSSSVTVNVAPGAIVIDRPASTADVAAGVQRAFEALARTRLSRDGH